MNIVRNETIGPARLLLGTAPGALSDLHPLEQALLRPRATGKRAADFIAGRLLAKEALRQACGAGEWIIDRDVGVHEGAPIVRGPRAAHVSISHVDGWVATVASSAQVAVDLVKLEALPEALCEEAFTRDERSAWGTADPHAMATAFAAKEAALKWLKTGMGTALHALLVLPRGLDAIEIRMGAERTTLTCSKIYFTPRTRETWLALTLLQRRDA